MVSPKKSVLLVEDDFVVHGVIAKTLKQWDLEIVHARDGNEAKKQIIQNGGGFGLFILDLILPDGPTGWEILDLIRSRPEVSDTSVLVLTGVAMSDEEEKRLKRTADVVMRKQQFDIATFKKAMDKLLEAKDR